MNGEKKKYVHTYGRLGGVLLTLYGYKDGVSTRKLWQTDIIKITQEILDKTNKGERQEVPCTKK